MDRPSAFTVLLHARLGLPAFNKLRTTVETSRLDRA